MEELLIVRWEHSGDCRDLSKAAYYVAPFSFVIQDTELLKEKLWHNPEEMWNPDLETMHLSSLGTSTEFKVNS